MAPLFRRLKLDNEARSYRALFAFHHAAGPAITGRARAEVLRGRILYVRVVSSAWSQQLHALKVQILDKLRRTPGGEEVQDLRFRVGPLTEAPDWEAPDDEAPIVPQPALPGLLPALAVETPADLTAALAAVADDDLRDQIDRLYHSFKARAPRRDA
jgi:hypothetical protein